MPCFHPSLQQPSAALGRAVGRLETGTDRSCLTSAVTRRQLSPHSNVAAGMLLTCLPSSPLFPFLLGRAVEAAATLHRPEHTDSPLGGRCDAPRHRLRMGSAQLLPRWHRFVVGLGHAAKSRCPSIPSRAVFHGVISESCLSAGSGLSGAAAHGGGREAPRYWKELERVARDALRSLARMTSAKNCLLFVTSSSLQHLCGHRRSSSNCSLVLGAVIRASSRRLLLSSLPPSPSSCLPSFFCWHQHERRAQLPPLLLPCPYLPSNASTDPGDLLSTASGDVKGVLIPPVHAGGTTPAGLPPSQALALGWETYTGGCGEGRVNWPPLGAAVRCSLARGHPTPSLLAVLQPGRGSC